MSGTICQVCGCGASIVITYSDGPLPTDMRALAEWAEMHRPCGTPLEREGYRPDYHGDTCSCFQCIEHRASHPR